VRSRCRTPFSRFRTPVLRRDSFPLRPARPHFFRAAPAFFVPVFRFAPFLLYQILCSFLSVFSHIWGRDSLDPKVLLDPPAPLLSFFFLTRLLYRIRSRRPPWILFDPTGTTFSIHSFRSMNPPGPEPSRHPQEGLPHCFPTLGLAVRFTPTTAPPHFKAPFTKRNLFSPNPSPHLHRPRLGLPTLSLGFCKVYETSPRRP